MSEGSLASALIWLACGTVAALYLMRNARDTRLPPWLLTAYCVLLIGCGPVALAYCAYAGLRHLISPEPLEARQQRKQRILDAEREVRDLTGHDDGDDS